MHQVQSFAPQQPSAAEYAFPSVLQFLQSEWRRFERDRNEWDIEKAEMKARIAYLEGEKRGVDNTKLDLMKRVKMLEYALRQERSKYVEANNTPGVPKNTSSLAQSPQANNDGGPETANSPNNNNTNGGSNGDNNANKGNVKALNRMSTYSTSGTSATQLSPSSANLDLTGRAKSREFLRICLQEISYLTASVPQSVASALPPAQGRLSRNEYERRAIGVNGMRGAKNRHSDFFPSNIQVPTHPPLPRSNSVPNATIGALSKGKPTSISPPLDDTMSMTGPVDEANGDIATVKQQKIAQQPAKDIDRAVSEPARDPAPASAPNNEKPAASIIDQKSTDTGSAAQQETTLIGAEAFQQDELVTVVHAPISGEQWHAELQKAGRQLANGKKAGEKAEDEAQLSKDVQDKFNLTPEQLSKMVKGWEWEKPKQDAGAAKNSSDAKGKIGDDDELAALSISDTNDAESSGATKTGDASGDEPILWRPKVTLKRHMDTVRSVTFHPTDKALLSGSEDGTMKYWNLESALTELKRPLNGELEPVHTYRGHTKPITAVAISADQSKCFSASMDSTVRSWKLVPSNKETYARIDPSLSLSSFIGHTDTVWDIRLFPLSVSSSQLMASISADGALKIWDTETKGSPLRSSWGYNGLEASELMEPTGAYTSGLAKLPTPTSLDFCPTDLRKLVVSYSNAVTKLFDIETGKEILAFKSDESYDGTRATQINKVISHPTLPIVITGHEDRHIRFFDMNSGICSFSMVSHLEAVSSLDIDPTGLVLCSGGHDGSVRLWDIASSNRTCLQEFTGHRRKSDEGVTTVRYHPVLPGLLATGGADSIVKVYTRG